MVGRKRTGPRAAGHTREGRSVLPPPGFPLPQPRGRAAPGQRPRYTTTTSPAPRGGRVLLPGTSKGAWRRTPTGGFTSAQLRGPEPGASGRVKEAGRAGQGRAGGRERAEGKSRRAWRGGGAEGGQPGCGKRGSALGLVPSQPFSVQPNSRFAEGANQGRTGGLCLAPANDW